MSYALGFILLLAQPQEDSAEVFRQIWSPYCKGVSLLECPSSQAQELRDRIRDRMQKGETKEEVLQDLYREYGTEIRMVPPESARTTLANLLPWVVLLLAGIFIWIFWQKRRKKCSSSPKNSTPPRLDKATEAKILEDLERRMQ